VTGHFCSSSRAPAPGFLKLSARTLPIFSWFGQGPRCFYAAREGRNEWQALTALMKERGLANHEASPLFVGTHDARLTRFGATHIVRRAVAIATAGRSSPARLFLLTSSGIRSP
jgi:hypothetical protein